MGQYSIVKKLYKLQPNTIRIASAAKYSIVKKLYKLQHKNLRQSR